MKDQTWKQKLEALLIGLEVQNVPYMLAHAKVDEYGVLAVQITKSVKARIQVAMMKHDENAFLKETIKHLEEERDSDD